MNRLFGRILRPFRRRHWPEMINVVIEFRPSERRVVIRGARIGGGNYDIEPLEPGNIQSTVTCLNGLTMDFPVGIGDLIATADWETGKDLTEK